MNQLPIEKRTQIIQLLVEGNSLRSTSRIKGCSINTVTKLLVDVGRACLFFHDATVNGVKSQRVQCDEIWSFVYAKGKNASEEQKEEGAGDIWTWTAIDADSKLIISWYVGDRSAQSAQEFMSDVASRLDGNKVQISTDPLTQYKTAIEHNFELGMVDYNQEIKQYGSPMEEGPQKKYSPTECTGSKRRVIQGNPDKNHISTSRVERQNLTMRMHMRRFTRLTNGFSKKVENHCYAIALHFVYYNFARIHKTLRVTPAMEAGLTKSLMSIEDIVNLTNG